jgi:hypothetical protein
MSYIGVRGLVCLTIVPTVYASREDNTGDVKIGFFKELERVFDKFPEYHMKIMLENLITKVGKEHFLNGQLGMKICTKLVIILELE